MQQQARLFTDCRDQPWVGMPDIGHRHTGHRVEVFAALLVPQARAQATGEAQGQGLIRGHQAGGGHGGRLQCIVGIGAVSLAT